MASTQGIRAGRAFVELFADDSRLVRGLRRAEKRLRAFGDRIRNFGLKLAGVVSAAVAPLGLLAIRATSDAQESLSRFEAVFKYQAKAAGAFADALAQSVGRSKIEIRDAMATFQSFFVGLGFGGTESRKLSQTLQTLALDFASFHNLTDDEAVGRFISALSGSGEVLDRFGINIKQAALEQELLRMGIRKSWTEVTEQEKALARLNIIMGAMGDQGAVGDAVRTAGSFANQMKRLRGQLRDAAVEIGQALLPVVTPLVTKAAEVAKRFGQWISENRQLVATVFKVVAAAVAAAGAGLVVLGTMISGIGMVMGTLATIVTGVGTALGLLASALGLLLSPIGLVVAAVGALGVVLLKTSGVGAQALAWLGERFEALRATAMRAWRGIADALAAGDIALAARVLWMALRVQWLKGVGDVVHVDLMLGNHGNHHRDFKLAGKVDPQHISLELIAPDGRRTDLKPRLRDLGTESNPAYWTARVQPDRPGLHRVVCLDDKVVHYAPIRSIKSAKTFFVASENLDAVPAAEGGFDKPLGHPLELVLETDPAALAPGQPVEVQLLYEGQPLKDTRVSFIPRGMELRGEFDERYERRTDEEGSARFTPQQGNVYLIAAHHKAPEKNGEGYESTKYSATITLYVPAKPAGGTSDGSE